MMTRDYAAPDWRGLCAELADELDHYRQLLADDRREAHPLAVEARAALAQPEPEVVGPSDEELLELAQHHSVSYTLSDGSVVYPLQEGCDMRDDVLSFARAVLARWGRPAPAPAEGEVAELVALIRQIALAWEPDACLLGNMTAGQLARAANLLEQRHPTPVPVAVSERLPGPEDCDAEGRAWFLSFPFEYNRMIWSLEDRTYGCNTGFTHWLPASSLPLPQVEVE